jgi:dipeptidyl aminopeptidase/acylaminoacyl peptidase
MSFVRTLAIASVVLTGATSLGAQAKRAFTPADWYKLTNVSAPAMSPDGSRIAFTVQTVNERDNKYHREVWVVATAGGTPQRFTSQRPGGKGSTWMLRMDQPGGEAYQDDAYPRIGTVSADNRVSVWAEGDSLPGDSARRADDPFSKMQPMARPPYGSITKPIDPARFDGRHVYEMTYKSNNAGFVPGRREARRWNPAQLYAQTFDGSPKRRITNTRYAHGGAVVSPDGQWVAFVADAQLRPDSVVAAERDSLAQLPYDKKRDDIDRNNSDIYVIPIAGGTPRKVASFFGDEGGLAWSPDSKRLAFIAAPGRTKSDRVYVVNVSGGTPENLLGTFKYEPSNIAWLPDGSIAMATAVGGSNSVYRIDPATKKLTPVLSGRRRVSGLSFDAKGTKVAYVSTDITKPTELYVANADGSGERKLTSFNDKLVSEIAFSDAERFTYPSVGGLEIEGWLMRPYGYEAGKKYPVVLYIHGGPHSAYGETWFDEFQNLAATGMFVLFTNPRGSRTTKT